MIDQDLSLDGSPLLENPSVKQLRINWNIIFKTLEKISKSSSSQSSEKSTAIQHFYPKNDGFMDDPKMEYLTPGTIIMRYGGSDYSRFFTLYANDVPSSLLAPPPGTTNQIRKFKVKKPMHVLSGLIMPHFGEVGTWPQYVTPVKLKLLLEQGFLKECFEEGKPNSTEKSFSSECTNLDGEQAISKEAIKELEQDI